jgi:DNA-binding transcriptional MerR regulator
LIENFKQKPYLLGSSEAARQLRIHVYTLLRWEQTGLLVPTTRDSAGRRLYDAAEVQRVVDKRAATRVRKEQKDG